MTNQEDDLQRELDDDTKVPYRSYMGALLEFHKTYGAYIGSFRSPCLPAQERCELRYSLIREELEEFKEACEHHDFVGAVDGLIDLLYVVFGSCVELGIEPKLLFDEVHRSNMSKLMPDGTVKRRDDGKILKGPDFFKPDLEALLIKQGWAK
jgi:hypothetical protein